MAEIEEELVTVFTPTHNMRYLVDAYKSLKAQTHTRWNWIILANGIVSADMVELILGLAHTRLGRIPDARVTIADADPATKGVGALKKECLTHVLDDSRIYLELDHDDMLHPEAIEHVVKTFESDPDIVFTYSDSAYVDEHGNRYRVHQLDGDNNFVVDADGAPVMVDYLYSGANGWKYREERDGLLAVESLKPTPHNVSLIWYAPNHLRAFTRAAYEAAGGYDARYDVLDDQDLMSRLFQQGKFAHIPKTLYKQRMHGANTQSQLDTNARIQLETWDLYEKHLQANVLAWTGRQGLIALELGCGANLTDGYTMGYDLFKGPAGSGIFAKDLNEGIPLADNSCGVVRAVDFLEHIADKQFMLNEIHRVLAPGGMLLSLTPSTDGRGAFQDPTHVSYWNENSWWYCTNERYLDNSPQNKAGLAHFQVSRVRTMFPSGWHVDNKIPYVQANVIAIKTDRDSGKYLQPRNGGELNV